VTARPEGVSDEAWREMKACGYCNDPNEEFTDEEKKRWHFPRTPEGEIIADGPPVQTIGHDPVNSPAHYTQRAGIECIDVTEHMTFNIGNAVKYLWRHEDKGSPVEDLRKAEWYIRREIKRLCGE